MNLKNLFIAFFTLIIAFLFILGVFSFLMLQNQKELLNSQEIRFKSYAIANELKQSSEDLTRFCRNYVQTGDKKWEKKYWEVLDIRNGKSPRPDGRIISLQDSMKKLGFTETEFAKLRVAEDNSNNLTLTELVAMNAVKGLFADQNGNFTIKRKPDPAFASRIMFDTKYHSDKEKIMNPIADFFLLIDRRTAEKLALNNKISYNLLYSIIGSILIVSLMTLISFFFLKEKIIKQLLELKIAYSKIEESEMRFRMFMDHLPGLAFIKDHDKRVIFTNKGFNTYLNINPASIMQKTSKEIFPREFAEKIDSDDQRVLDTGIKEVIEEHFADRDWTSYKFILPGIGGQQMLGGITVDVTERKKAEEASRKLSQAVEQSPASIVITNAKGIIEYVNPKFSELTGYSFKEAIGNNPSILKSGTMTTDEYNRLWQNISSGLIWRGEFCNKKKNGELYWEAASISPILDNVGKITHYVAIKEDITNKKQTEQSLQYERKLLRILIDNIPDLIYSKDKYARKTLANLADIRLMGLNSESEAIGKDDFAFYPYERAKEFVEEDMKVIETGKPALNTEGWHINNKGQNRYYITSKYPLRNEKEQIIGLVGIGRDITERKLKELELEKQLTIQTNLVKLLRKEVDSSLQFLDEVLEVALNITESKIGYIYYYNEVTKEFTLNTWSKEVMNECSVLEPQTIYQLEKTGIWGEAVRQRKEIIINDFKADNPMKKGYPEGHVNLIKFLTIPIFQKDQIAAVVGVANKKNDYDQVDVNNLQLLVSSIWAKVDKLKTEVALKESEDRIRKLGDNLPSGYTYQYVREVDGSSHFTYVSAGIKRINGLTPEEVINDINVFNKQVLEPYRKLIREAEEKSYKDLSVFHIEIPCRVSSGELKWLRLKSTPRPLSNGRYIWDGWIIDITEQKQAEEALRKSESNLREAQAIAHIGSWEVNLETNTITGSEEAARIYGLEPLGRSLPLTLIQSAVVEQYRKRLDEILKGLITNKSIYDEIYQIKRLNDNKLRWIHSVAERIDDASGRPVKVAGSIQDITEWKNAELALRESESRFQSIFKNSLVSTSITSLDSHKYIDINDTFILNTGYTREDVIGRTIEEVNLFYDDRDRLKLLEEISEKGFISGMEVKLILKNGEKRLCLLSANVIDTSNETFLISTVVDITDRKHAEEALKESEASLRELNATKDKFFSVIAHDLKSPFHALLGFSQILSKDYKTLKEEERISFIGHIDNLIRNSYKLLENLLEWSRIQTGKMTFNPENFDLLLELYQSLGLLKQIAQNKNQEFNFSIDESLKIFADKNMLLTILRNIVSNSIKFTKPGGQILLNVQSNDNEILFSVADNGIGIRKNNLSRLFSLENNLSTKGTNNEAGTGLGLILCKEMIEKHGGKIWVESTEGVGTTFYFTIPNQLNG